MSFVVTVNDGVACWSQDAMAALRLAETCKREAPEARVVVGYGEVSDLHGSVKVSGPIHPVMVVN
jgi:hypothetical protein